MKIWDKWNIHFFPDSFVVGKILSKKLELVFRGVLLYFLWVLITFRFENFHEKDVVLCEEGMI